MFDQLSMILFSDGLSLLREDLLMLNFYPDLKKGVETEDSKTEFIFMIDRSGRFILRWSMLNNIVIKFQK